MTKRIFVGYGQWGPLFSPTIPLLANKLKPFGKVTLHLSSKIADVIAEINRYPRDTDTKFVLVGYSLNGSYMGDYLCRYLKPNRWLDLMVSIDATRQYANVKSAYLTPSMFKSVTGKLPDGAQPTHSAPCFRRIISFHNADANPFGGATYVGKNVDYYRLPWTTHLAAQGNKMVWDTTVEAVEKL